MKADELFLLDENRGAASGFRGLRTMEDLAQLLDAPLSDLLDLAIHSEVHYQVYHQPKQGGGLRWIEKPSSTLKNIQKKIQVLLKNEPLPIFVGAPNIGRSNITNAAAHRDRRHVATLDIKNYFTNCRMEKIAELFTQRMSCSEEVATLLVRLVCFKGHLPTGAPSSPLLAYFAYEEMYNGLYLYFGDMCCRLSIYADDFTISWKTNDRAPLEVLEGLDNYFSAFGLRLNGSKTRLYGQKRPACITGIIVMPNGEMRVPNRIHKKLYETQEKYRNASGLEKQRLEKVLNGLTAYMRQIKTANRQRFRRFDQQEG